MPPKPRPAKPKPRVPKRGAPTPAAGGDRTLMYGFAAAGVVALVAVVGFLALAGGEGRASVDEARTALDGADCSLQSVAARPGVHSVENPEGKAKWNTNPPTNGPHFGGATTEGGTAIWGAYTDQLNDAQVVHNLEHGGIFIQYGFRVPEETVAQLQAFYDDHKNGTLLFPRPQLGDEIALGAWTYKSSGPKNGTAYLARCRSFDQAAFDKFFSAFQFQGPERYGSDSLLPGQN